MFEYAIICIVALTGSALTLFSGFGLGTILVPVFGLFFPIELAIALTAIVHFLNNIFKLFLFGKKTDLSVLKSFGIPSVIAAFLGALLLTKIAQLSPLFEYSLWGKTFQVMPVKSVIAFILLFFALVELIPKLSQMQFDRKYLPLGGFLTGFFGGLSGNQGALRSAFLIRANLSKEAFIATGVVLACLIDIARLSVYSTQILKVGDQMHKGLIISATLSAFAGAYFGSKMLAKITIKQIQILVAAMLMLFSILLLLGII